MTFKVTHIHRWIAKKTIARKGVGFEVLERCSRCYAYRSVLVEVDVTQQRAFTKITPQDIPSG